MFQLIFSNIVGIVLYLGVINLIAAAVTVYDKKQARAHGRRVPEKNLFTFGNSWGCTGDAGYHAYYTA